MIGPRHPMSSHIFILLGLVRSLGADVHPSPLETMSDVTNDFGVCVLQIIASPHVNTVFSPYGLMSMALLVYEGTRGQAAAEIYNSLHLPWHRDIVRIGFRDLHRYLKSYFSSEGFLKGLVLSKPNVTLRDSYIDVLKFYGFQSDTSITQPVFTTQASVGNREGNETMTSSETTTSQPITTTQLPTTTMTTMKPQTTKPEGSGTTIPTTLGTTDIIMGTNKPPTQPDILSMQGPEDGKTTVPPTTTILTTIITTKGDTPATESEITTLAPTKEPPVKTTLAEETTTATKGAETTDDEMSTTSLNKESTVTQNTKTESSTPEMDVVTMTNPTPSELESMNMVMDMTNKTEVIGTENPENDLDTTNSAENETEMKDGKTTITDFVSSIANEVTTKEIFTGVTGTETVTVFVDTTLPLEQVTVLTTPLEAEVLTDKNSPLFEAVVLMEENVPSEQDLEFSTTYNLLNKRSTESNNVNEPMTPEYTTPSNTLYSALQKNNITDFNRPYNSENQTFNATDKDQILVNSVLSNLIKDVDNINFSHLEPGSTESTIDPTDLSDEGPGFPTLEPDTIIFPTKPRTQRAVKYDDKLQSAALGNWVGSSGWHPSPTEQWFWTFTGDKLVPVLTYTAFLPYADVPALRATALQLPLDDVRYTLMILLPRQARGLKQLLYSLQWCPLRTILKQFRPTPVYAVVPTFTIVKHINLTPALHKLGVRKIFDGFQANLCEMSDEPNLYVRSVEQVITISFQKYFTNQNWIEASPSQVEQHFLATHPFAYFVVDLETKVALVAGSVVDPMDRNS